MIRLLLDENFNGKIARGLRARQPDVDMIRVQDTELFGAEDPDVLEWTAKEGRILLTHDLETMTKYANERLE
jgi:predicted nuclease of predicted toxin-antitoxin system